MSVNRAMVYFKKCWLYQILTIKNCCRDPLRNLIIETKLEIILSLASKVNKLNLGEVVKSCPLIGNSFREIHCTTQLWSLSYICSSSRN